MKIVKKITLLFLLFVSLLTAKAQTLFYNDGGQIFLQNTAFIEVQGGLENKDNGPNKGFFTNNGTIYVSGNWINNSTDSAHSAITGTVELNGANQDIGGTQITTFNNLSLTGTGIKTLQVNTIISGNTGTLKLNDRPFDLNSKTAFVTNNQPVAITYTTGYIISETDPLAGYGIVDWKIGNAAAGNNFIIPFGTIAANYIPLIINVNSNGSGTPNDRLWFATYPTNVTPAINNRPLPTGVTNLNNPCGGEHAKKTIDRFWPSGSIGFSTAPTSEITFTYLDAEWNNTSGSTNIINESSLKLESYVSNNWNILGGTTNSTGNTTSYTGINVYTPFSLCNFTPLVAHDTISNLLCFQDNSGTITVTIDSGTSNFSYAWSPNISNDSTATNIAAGSYQVHITDDAGCDTLISNILVTEPAALNINDSVSDVTCFIGNDGFITTTTTGGMQPYSYSWQPPVSTNSSANNLTPGNYSVSVTDANGCSQIKTINVTQTSAPTASVSATQIAITIGDHTQLSATGGGTYKWTPVSGLSCITCQNPVATPAHTTNYCVEVRDVNNCTDSACITINVDIPCNDLQVPNAFSPNNDGHNDAFSLPGWADCIKEFRVLIYDRWGEKVFESNDVSFRWDGTSTTFSNRSISKQPDKPMNSAVFVYYIKATDTDGTSITRKGNISLIW